MCCPLDQVQGRFILGNMTHTDKKIAIHGDVDFAPVDFGGRCIRIFQRMELTEKIAEIVDETFHLLGSVLKSYASLEIFEFFKELHHGAHSIEHGLHSICFIGDIIRIPLGKFLERDQDGNLDYLKTASRVLHTTSHFFASLQFLSDLKICSLGKAERFVKLNHLISSVAFGIWTASIIVDYFKTTPKKENTFSDLAIHGGGCLFEGLNHVKNLERFSASYRLLSKAAAIPGIIHAWFVASRLLNDKSPIHLTLKNQDNQWIQDTHQHSHDGHHACDHDHE